MHRLPFAAPLLLALASLAGAGGSMEQLLSNEALLYDERRDVYVVEVVKVDDEGATQANPPRVTFKVRETLRGDLKPGDELTAPWMPVQHDIDTTGRAEELKRWKETPMKGPEKDRVFIVMDQSVQEGEAFRVSFRCRFEFSERKRDDVAKTIRQAREYHAAAEKERKEHAAKVEKRRAEDARALEAIDVAAAAKAAPVVVLGELCGFERELPEVRLLLGYHRVLKGADGPAGAYLDFHLDFAPTADERLTLESRSTDPATSDVEGWKGPRVLVFLNAPADPRHPDRVTLVNGLASIVPATAERLKAVREALGLKEEGK